MYHKTFSPKFIKDFFYMDKEKLKKEWDIAYKEYVEATNEFNKAKERKQIRLDYLHELVALIDKETCKSQKNKKEKERS